MEEVVCSGHVFVQAVGTGPGVTDEAEEEVVLPDAGDLLWGVVLLPAQHSTAQHDVVQDRVL